MITIISALDMADGIGDKDGNLLYNIPKDMKHFKDTTSGGVVVMGRKTWDSLKKKPLVGRKNYVLTTDKSFNPDGAKVLHSTQEVLDLAKSYKIFVIGGEQIYRQMLSHADELILTHIHNVDISAVTFFPPVPVQEWRLEEAVKSESTEKHPSFTIAKYTRK